MASESPDSLEKACRGGGMVDAMVSKTIGRKARAGSSPALGTTLTCRVV